MKLMALTRLSMPRGATGSRCRARSETGDTIWSFEEAIEHGRPRHRTLRTFIRSRETEASPRPATRSARPVDGVGALKLEASRRSSSSAPRAVTVTRPSAELSFDAPAAFLALHDDALARAVRVAPQRRIALSAE